MAAQSTTYRNALLGPAASNGYPVRAPASWNPGDYNSVFPGLMSLQRGDEGRLEGHDPDYLKDPSGWEKDGHRVWVRVTITRRRGKLVNISGRVPKDLLQIGTERKYGEYVTELVRDTTLPSSKTTNRSLPAGDRVFQTACVLLKEFKDQQVHLGVSAASGTIRSDGANYFASFFSSLSILVSTLRIRSVLTYPKQRKLDVLSRRFKSMIQKCGLPCHRLLVHPYRQP